MPLRRRDEGLHRLRAAGDVPYSGGAPRQPKLHIARFPLREESSFIPLGLLSHSKPLCWVLNVFGDAGFAAAAAGRGFAPSAGGGGTLPSPGRPPFLPEERGERRVRNSGLTVRLFPAGKDRTGGSADRRVAALCGSRKALYFLRKRRDGTMVGVPAEAKDTEFVPTT